MKRNLLDGSKIFSCVTAGLTIALVFLGSCLPIAASENVEYPNSKFCPPPGRILHIAGQDRESFSDYLENVAANGSAFGLPAGASFYTSFELTGVTSPHANEPGDHHQDLPYLASVYEPLVFQIALWLGPAQLSGIYAGAYDNSIEALANHFKSYDRPIYFRIGYEFDGIHNKYDPQEYQVAYRHIVDRFRALGVTNVAYVWHSYAMLPTYDNHDVIEWYPGDEYVDWVGISFFQVAENEYALSINRDRVMEIAREKQKPVMICESSAIRYNSYEKTLNGQAYWDHWYVPYFEFIENNPEVKAFSIINIDWDSQVQFAHFYWGDAMISHDSAVLQNWREKMQEERYLHSGPELYEQLGYSQAGGFPWLVLGVVAVCLIVIGLAIGLARMSHKIK